MKLFKHFLEYTPNKKRLYPDAIQTLNLSYDHVQIRGNACSTLAIWTAEAGWNQNPKKQVKKNV